MHTSQPEMRSMWQVKTSIERLRKLISRERPARVVTRTRAKRKNASSHFGPMERLICLGTRTRNYLSALVNVGGIVGSVPTFPSRGFALCPCAKMPASCGHNGTPYDLGRACRNRCSSRASANPLHH